MTILACGAPLHLFDLWMLLPTLPILGAYLRSLVRTRQ